MNESRRKLGNLLNIISGGILVSKKPTIFVLGAAHFSDVDNGDMVQIETKDILSETRQREMSVVIDSLKEFKPTKVAVEVVTELEERINENYASYLAGNFSLASNEIHQIGFRLAKKCDLDKVHAVDWNESLDDVPSIGQLGENKSTIYDDILQRDMN